MTHTYCISIHVEIHVSVRNIDSASFLPKTQSRDPVFRVQWECCHYYLLFQIAHNGSLAHLVQSIAQDFIQFPAASKMSITEILGLVSQHTCLFCYEFPRSQSAVRLPQQRIRILLSFHMRHRLVGRYQRLESTYGLSLDVE